MSTFFLSDLHLFHDREFVWKVRGFRDVEHMNDTILENIYKTISAEDDFYLLGDLALGTDSERIRNTAAGLPGKVHLIIGNHDTDSKIKIYKELPNFAEVVYSTVICVNKRELFLSHYPVLTAEHSENPKHTVFNIHGHTHSKERFCEERPYAFNVCCDALECKPILAEDMVEQLVAEFKKKLGNNE